MNKNDMNDLKEYLKKNVDESAEERAFITLVYSTAEPFVKLCASLKQEYPETWKLHVTAVITSFLLLLADNRDEAFEIESGIRKTLIDADKTLSDID